MKEGKTIELLCLGNVILKNNKNGIEYAILEDGKETSETMAFNNKKTTRGYPGGVYTVETKGESIWNLQFIKNWHDKERVSTLQLKSRANDTHRTALAQQKKDEMSDEALMKMIKPLRHIYHSTNSLGQTAIIARVINLMQRKL